MQSTFSEHIRIMLKINEKALWKLPKYLETKQYSSIVKEKDAKKIEVYELDENE